MIRFILILFCLTTISNAEVLIEIKHIKQEPYMCVPACAAMILDFYGEKVDQKELKKIMENINDNSPKLYTRTKFWKVEKALKTLGYNWQEKRIAINSGNKGINFIMQEIKNHNPVIVSVDAKYGQHAIVVHGYGKNYFIVSDPSESKGNTKYDFKNFRRIWNSNGLARQLIKTQNKI